MFLGKLLGEKLQRNTGVSITRHIVPGLDMHRHNRNKKENVRVFPRKIQRLQNNKGRSR